VLRALKLPAFCAGFELGLTPLMADAKETTSYVSLPKFPKVEQDICLRVPTETSYAAVYKLAEQTLETTCPQQTLFMLQPVDIYQRSDDESHKQVTLRLSIASFERTMTDDEVAKLLDDVAREAAETLAAERV